MELTIERGKFLDELQVLQGVVERKNTIPILANILLKAENGGLDLTSTDLDLTLHTVRSDDSPQARPRAVVGVLLGQATQIRLPIKVKIDLAGVGGPSAGLAFALDVLEELGRNVDRGHRIAATGEIHLDGSVGPIGGIKQKTIGARRAGVDAFLVPAGENAREARKYADGLRIIPVKSFQQALRALATL